MKLRAFCLAALLALCAAPLRADKEPEGTLDVQGAEGSLRLFRFETEAWPLEAGRPLPDNSRVELDAGAKLRLRYDHFLDFVVAGPARLTVYVVPVPAGVPGALQMTVSKIQDVGTHLMLSAELQGHTVKARLAVDAAQLSPGDAVWLKVMGEHTCFYKNEEIVA